MKILNLKIIACNVLWREICHYAALSPNRCDLQFLPWGLHGTPALLRDEVQNAIDAVPPDTYDAIILGYGLCSNGVDKVSARHTQLILIKGHDCVTCLLGSREKYKEYFDAHPGTYWYSPGWNENHLAPGKQRYDETFAAYVEKYGDENAKYLMEMEQDWFNKYSTAAFVSLPIGDVKRYTEYTKECAAWLSWKYDEIAGDAALLKRMLSGDWNDDAFLVVQPGYHIEPSFDEQVIKAVKDL